jgi:hypothetical protein
MEGITGVVHGEQVTSGNPEYAAARKWMAEDVNAAVEGAIAAGAGRSSSTIRTARCATSIPRISTRARF